MKNNDFFEEFNKKNPAEIVTGKVIEKQYSNGFFGEIYTIYAKVKNKVVRTEFKRDSLNDGKAISVGDTVKVKKQRSIGYVNRYEYKIIGLA